MLRIGFILIMLVFTVSSIAFSQSDEAFKRLQFIDDFVFHGIPLLFDTSDAKIRALGQVNKVDTDEYEAPHDKGLMIEKRIYYLDGLQVVAHFVKGNNSRGQLSKAVVTGAKWKIGKSLRVGSSIASVVKALGEPTAKRASSYEYCGETGVDCAIFEFVKDNVTRITFTYYLD